MAKKAFTLQTPINNAVTNKGLVLTGTTSQALTAPTFVDINGDGFLDAFIGTNDGKLSYFQNDGTNNFVNKTGTADDPLKQIRIESLTTPSEGVPVTPTFVDIDGDGDFDLFLGTNDILNPTLPTDPFVKGEIFFFRNNGTATNPQFKQPVAPSVEVNRSAADRSTQLGNLFNIVTTSGYANPTFVDINGDGRFDLFVGQYNYRTDSNPYIVYYENTTQDSNGNGVIELTEITFAPRTGASNPLNGISPVLDNPGNPPAFDILYPAFVKYSSQQVYDAFIGQRDGKVIYYKNTGTVQTPNFVQADAENPFADFNALPGGQRGERTTLGFINMDGLDSDGNVDFDAYAGSQKEETGIRFFLNDTLFPKIEVKRLDTNELVPDGTTLPITNVSYNQTPTVTTFQITNIGETDLNLGTPTIANPSLFNLNLGSFTPVVAPNATTSFTVALNSTNLNNLNAEVSSVIQFSTDDPDILQPFDFTVRGTVRSSKIEVKRGDQTITDGTTLPVNLGTLRVGTAATFTTFTITNNGLDDLVLGTPTVNNNAFILNTASYNNVVAPGSSTSFGVGMNSSGLGNFQGTVQFNANDPTIASPFDFAVTGSVTVDGIAPPPPPPPGSLLFYDAATGLFRVGAAGGDNLQLQLTSATNTSISEIRISKFSATGQLTAQQSLFSVQAEGFRPSGFGVNQQISIFSDVIAGDTFGIDLISPSRGTIAYNSSQLSVSQISSGQYSLNFGDIALSLQQTGSIPLGIQNQGIQTQLQPQQEILDLRSVEGQVRATFTLYREAAFTNTLGLYKIDSLDGTVNGVAPGSTGYAQAALNNRVEGISFNVGNQSIAQFSSVFAGGALYAPFIVVNGSALDLLTANPQNIRGSSDVSAYFPFMGANPDGVDHLFLYGSNIFGFEDLPGGGDRDFNDLIVQVSVNPV